MKALILLAAVGTFTVGAAAASIEGWGPGDSQATYPPPHASVPAASPPPSAMPEPTPLATLTPEPTDASTPAAPVVVGPAQPWTAAECTWAHGVLLDDQARDDAAAANYPALADYYHENGAHWGIAAADADRVCAAPSTWVLDHATCSQELYWYAVARGTHAGRLPVNDPSSDTWDSGWVAVYDGLTALWRRACP